MSVAPIEVPVYVPIRGEGLGAVVTVPSGGAGDVGVLLMAGRARDRAHRNGMWVSAARAIGERGMYAMRLDYPGVGASTGAPEVFDIDDPPAWVVRDACRFLLDNTPVTRVILAASCFGGRVMLSAAPEIPEAEALFMAASPAFLRRPTVPMRVAGKIRRVVRRAIRAVDAARSQSRSREYAPPIGRRVSPAFARPLAAFLRRGEASFLCGEADFATEEVLAGLERVKADPARYELEVVPGELHNYRTVECQILTVDRLVSWCERIAGRADRVSA